MTISELLENFVQKARHRENQKDIIQATKEFSLEAQIKQFIEETGKKLEIRDGGPYYNGDLWLGGCTRLTRLPDRLKTKGHLNLTGCTGLTHLPDELKVGRILWLRDCTRLTSLPNGLEVGGDLDICGTRLTSLPFDLDVEGDWIIHRGQLTSFFKKLGIPVDDEGDTKTEDWLAWRKAHGYLTENFIQKAKHKEGQKDIIQASKEFSLKAQIEQFEEETGEKLEIIDGYPYKDRDLYLNNCTRLTRLPDNLKVRGTLILTGCTGLTSLPDNLEVKDWLYLNGCSGLTSLPNGLKIGESLDLRRCTGLTSLPFDLVVGDHCFILHNSILAPFFKKLRIPVDDEGDTKAEDWHKWQKAHGYLTENFIQKARHKENKNDLIQDTSELLVKAQIEEFKEETGIELKIKDGHPYFSGDLNLAGNTELTSLPDDLEVERNLYLNSCIELTSLPDNLKVGGNLNLAGCTKLTNLPDNLKVGLSLNLADCVKLTSLPDKLRKVEGFLYLSGCSRLTSLPDDLKVGGSLNLNDCTGLTSLPAGLDVGRDLYLLRCTGLMELPDDLKVGGNLFWPR